MQGNRFKRMIIYSIQLFTRVIILDRNGMALNERLHQKLQLLLSSSMMDKTKKDRRMAKEY